MEDPSARGFSDLPLAALILGHALSVYAQLQQQNCGFHGAVWLCLWGTLATEVQNAELHVTCRHIQTKAILVVRERDLYEVVALFAV